MGVTWLSYLARNRQLGVGLALLLGMIAFAVIGGLLVDPQNARPLSARVLQPPSWALPFGSDRQGRNLFAVITTGTLLTLRIGLIAGILGVGIGAAIAFVAAYYGGWVDSILRSIVDVGLTVPNLMILIVVALTLRQGMTVNVMAVNLRKDFRDQRDGIFRMLASHHRQGWTDQFQFARVFRKINFDLLFNLRPHLGQ